MAFAAGIGTIISALGSAVGAMSAVSQAQYQAQVAKNNSVVAANNAQIASEQSQREQQSNDEKTAALVGSQIAIQSASGLDAGRGSTLRVRQSTQRLGRRNALNIRQQGTYDVQNFMQQSENFKAESAAQSNNATGAAIAGVIDVASAMAPSLVSGGTTTKMANRIATNDPWITQSGLNLRNVG